MHTLSPESTCRLRMYGSVTTVRSNWRERTREIIIETAASLVYFVVSAVSLVYFVVSAASLVYFVVSAASLMYFVVTCRYVARP